ncbi:LysE/ArgO family amino acid transporter [Cellulomonas dongxiuzhuiae]|uniref:LysE/ArgO family amino acid transporter n=1 Tax=Cellulomonas dongxiuzhuiae TaxID=2819979 RepID=A0ABX8GJY2_9CELL|nr:LysE/ArgO family amino acid transporter [Cellulomonas dongxiuzhuiae]MBO3089258.1 amino acid transporter [Cellulomonas dongxiuzhuiae]MBO3094956.1 amino acid transporter [Cellulomonas dongxiuzhuiae]QWC15976.1 LysE/ArgO family amino acid transporter [Cellulomonas dongxiuzhuiae]
MWSSAWAGLGLGLGLIVAIGAQNAHVLRYGLRRERVGLVVAICAVSDVLLIAAGTAGVGAVIAASRTLTVVMTLAGAAVLLAYGALAARRAVRGDAALVVDAADRAPARAPAAGAVGVGGLVAATLALTWLNPHVYLDTVVLLGSVAAGHGDARWWFAAGAAVGSVVWFTALGYGAALLRPVFARPVAWRVLDVVIACVMVAIAVGLVVDLVTS